MSEENKAMVRRLVEAINTGDEDEAVDELFAPRAARRVKRLFAEFRTAFPDWHEEESIFGVNPDATWVVIAVVIGRTVVR